MGTGTQETQEFQIYNMEIAEGTSEGNGLDISDIYQSLIINESILKITYQVKYL